MLNANLQNYQREMSHLISFSCLYQTLDLLHLVAQLYNITGQSIEWLGYAVSTTFIPSIVGESYLVAANGLQSLWSLVLAIIDAYALLVGCRLQNPRLVSLFAVGDGPGEIRTSFLFVKFKPCCWRLQVTSTLTFTSACASAGITVLIENDLGACRKNHCTQLKTATAMSFFCWFTALPSFLFNFWSLASR
ncbi:hypothetical protein CDL12_01697 [Handroanthus impetiginosus]|uniref:CASP-like protein n=1 Tax=Handroanthus impetiginosus TaxID=429701 RepID=A0A2G9I715_9LAMI|nr:hypothetical protein CDL12_01697 [Handroanthus impetiginosus]